MNLMLFYLILNAFMFLKDLKRYRKHY